MQRMSSCCKQACQGHLYQAGTFGYCVRVVNCKSCRVTTNCVYPFGSDILVSVWHGLQWKSGEQNSPGQQSSSAAADERNCGCLKHGPFKSTMEVTGRQMNLCLTRGLDFLLWHSFAVGSRSGHASIRGRLTYLSLP